MDTGKLRRKILDLAIHGYLVPQDPSDEPASALLGRIREEKARLAKAGRLKAPGKSSPTASRQCPFEIPQGWEWTTVGEICEINSAKRVLKSDWKSNGVPFYRAREVVKLSKYNRVNNELFISPELYNDYKKKYGVPEAGDILVSAVGTIGATYIVRPQDVFYYKDASVICLSNRYDINANYVHFLFGSQFLRGQMYSNSKGTTVDTITIEKASAYQIPLPPLAEQRRIVAELERWFALIDRLEGDRADLQTAVSRARSKVLDLAIHGKLVPQDPADEPASALLGRIREEKHRLIKEGKLKSPGKASSAAKMQYPFEIPKGWEWTTLGEITNYGNCTNVGVEQIGADAWILELEDIEKDSARVINKVIKSQRNISGVRHAFYKDNILYSKLRTYLNKVLVAPGEGFCTTEIIPFSTYGSISPKYICHVLRSPYFLEYTLQCGYGVKMPRLGTTDACGGLIPLPPLPEQRRIVKKIEEIFATLDSISGNL